MQDHIRVHGLSQVEQLNAYQAELAQLENAQQDEAQAMLSDLDAKIVPIQVDQTQTLSKT